MASDPGKLYLSFLIVVVLNHAHLSCPLTVPRTFSNYSKAHCYSAQSCLHAPSSISSAACVGCLMRATSPAFSQD